MRVFHRRLEPLSPGTLFWGPWGLEVKKKYEMGLRYIISYSAMWVFWNLPNTWYDLKSTWLQTADVTAWAQMLDMTSSSCLTFKDITSTVIGTLVLWGLLTPCTWSTLSCQCSVIMRPFCFLESIFTFSFYSDLMSFLSEDMVLNKSNILLLWHKLTSLEGVFIKAIWATYFLHS